MDIQTDRKIYYEVASEDFPMLPSHAGIIPDRADESKSGSAAYICAFKDEMPQNIITRVVQFNISTIVLCGNESPTYINNLRHTLASDIMPDLAIWKVIAPHQSQAYEHCTDAIVIDVNETDQYKGKHPFLITGITGDDDIQALSHLNKEGCIGYIKKVLFGDTE